MATVTGGEKMVAALQKYAGPKALTLRVGFLENATYPDGKPVAMIAAIQEYGAPKAPLGAIPPRPFFRNMVGAQKGGWGAAIAAELKASDYDAETALKSVGEMIAGELQLSIRATISPPLSEVTMLLRGKYPLDQKIGKRQVLDAIHEVKSGKTSGLSGTSAKPLVRTGHLLNSVGYDVK